MRGRHEASQPVFGDRATTLMPPAYHESGVCIPSAVHTEHNAGRTKLTIMVPGQPSLLQVLGWAKGRGGVGEGQS
ncbi:hypothetical protein F5B17DRAFT_390142 [Nemania serpens]|nr:hypothetical protein F5B17DRAFT_390142 [Nemania serpens]